MTALDTGTEDLRAEIDGGVAVITMNGPDRRNAFSHAMVSALGAVLAQVETDDTAGCVVLTGAGGAFCAGGDVKDMAAPQTDRGDGAGPSPDARIHRQRLNQRATSGRLWSMPKPTIAAIGGPRPGPACHWRWPAICATRCRGRCSPPPSPRSRSPETMGGHGFSPGWWAAAKPKSSTASRIGSAPRTLRPSWTNANHVFTAGSFCLP